MDDTIRGELGRLRAEDLIREAQIQRMAPREPRRLLRRPPRRQEPTER